MSLHRFVLAFGGLLTIAWLSTSSTAGQVPPPPTKTAPDIPGVVAAGTKIEPILTYDRSLGGEGPLPTPDGGMLFCQQDQGKILKIDKDGHVSTYLEKTNRTVGLGYDREGRLVGTGGVPPGLVVLAPTRSVLADAFEGVPIGRPNDLVVDSSGGIYFTDTLVENPGPPPPPGRKPTVFYRKPNGQLMKVTENVTRPNGIQLSPDEKVLYVANPPGEFVIAFDVQADKSVRNQRDFARLVGPTGEPGPNGGADGLAVDAAGRLYVASTAGVQVFSPAGQALGIIPVPFKPANLAFGGPNKKTLFIVGRGGAYKIQMLAEGLKNRAK